MANHDVALTSVALPIAEPAPEPALLPVVTYTATSELVHPWHLVQELWSDIVRGRELGWRLFVRNLQSQYRQTLLGYFWAILPPLITTLVWVGLRSINVVSFTAAPGVPYAAYILTGTILWQTFLNSLTSPLTAIEGAKDMLAKLNFPREALLLAGLGQMLFNLLIQLILLAILLVVMRSLPADYGPAVFRGSLDAHHAGPWDWALDHTDRPLIHRHSQGHPGVRALCHALDACLVRTPTQGRLVLLNYLNPVAPVLVVTRDWILIGHTDFLGGFLVYAIAGLVATMLGLILVRIAMPFLIERMGS